ncbi:MAG: hypothetical protein ACI90V_010275, partial [Bacillariaceae sp.]|jgi:hypothetical protein
VFSCHKLDLSTLFQLFDIAEIKRRHHQSI